MIMVGKRAQALKMQRINIGNILSFKGKDERRKKEMKEKELNL